MRPRMCQMVIAAPPANTRGSWWVEAPREGFSRQCEAELPRLRNSRGATLVSGGMVVGEAPPRPRIPGISVGGWR